MNQERLVPGWLGQSSLPPQRRQEIEGVSAKTAIALKAVTEQAKEQARDLDGGLLDRSERGSRRGRGLDLAAKLGPCNPGVNQRNEMDKLHIKQTATGDRHSEVQAALTKKARTYEMLQSGMLRDDDGEYEVDFLRKETTAEERQGAAGSSSRRGNEEVDTTGLAVSGSGGLMSADMQRESDRRKWEAEEDQRREKEERRYQHKQDILDIHEDALEQRERAEVAKRDKEQRREQLKQKILQDKVREMLLKKAQSQPKKKPKSSAQATESAPATATGAP